MIGRGVARCRIFDDQRDFAEFLLLLGRLVKDSGASCLAWSLLPNHFHLLVRTGRWPLKMLMQRLLIRYSMYYNRRHRRSGHLFQNRYKSILCEDDPYLLELVRYIHLNPLRAGLVKGYGDLARHPWCGHGALLGTMRTEWQETGDVLAEFGRGRRSAAAALGEYMREGAAKARRPELEGEGPVTGAGAGNAEVIPPWRRQRGQCDERILGSGEYVAKVLREEEHRDRRRAETKGRLKPSEVIERAAEALGIGFGEVYGRSKRREVSHARSLASKWLVEDLGMTVTEASRLMKVTVAAVCYGVKKGREVEEETGADLGI